MDLVDALHLREPWEALKIRRIPHHRHSYWYYLGGLALFFLAIQVVTGLLLLCYYRPTPEAANQSVRMIVSNVPFGIVIRSIHAWAANILIAIVIIHTLSVFFMKSYRTPRVILWITGIVLLLILLGFGFTGYLLPWDQTSYFATMIGTELPREIPVVGDILVSWFRGSKEITGATLTRMYGLHVALLPLLALAFAATHVAISTLLGRAVPAGAKVKRETRFIPDYLLGESIIWLIGLAILLVVAVLFPWPLGPAYDLAKPSEPPAGVHPAWYFMFLYQTLKYLPNWATLWFYLIILLFWTLVPWLARVWKSWLLTGIGIILIAGFGILTTLAYFSVAQEKAGAKIGQISPTILPDSGTTGQ
ncbi:MAG TPA: cytochrome bc complex cytochrome b subunit [Candidatus Kapabacteria bacterium]|nr:cytochrome bc complex cytochrome b subunit [Candidatus Kapabacteria bacterium]